MPSGITAVLDTNVVISALLTPGRPMTEILGYWRSGQFAWVSSRPLLDELERVLSYTHIVKALRSPPAQTQMLLNEIARDCLMVSPGGEIHAEIRDPDDVFVVATAVAGNATHIVTGDKGLLDLGSYEGIEVVTPARFLTVLTLASEG